MNSETFRQIASRETVKMEQYRENSGQYCSVCRLECRVGFDRNWYGEMYCQIVLYLRYNSYILDDLGVVNFGYRIRQSCYVPADGWSRTSHLLIHCRRVAVLHFPPAASAMLFPRPLFRELIKCCSFFEIKAQLYLLNFCNCNCFYSSLNEV